MNLRDLRYLIAVVQHGHFGRAAEACFVSQPTLSAQLRKLEERLGLQLLERDKQGARLTEAGRDIHARAQSIVLQADALLEAARAYQNPLQGQIKLGLIHTLGPYLLPLLMPQLQNELPDLECLLLEDQTSRLLLRLEAGEIDAAFLAMPVDVPGLTSIPLFEEGFLLAVPNRHGLAEKSEVRVADLLDQPLLLLEDGHCLRDQALQFCAQAGPSERAGFQATSLETLRQMVRAGSGLSFFPALSAWPLEGVTYRHFSGQVPSRQMGLVYRRSSAKQIALQAVASSCRQAVSGVEAVRALK